VSGFCEGVVFALWVVEEGQMVCFCAWISVFEGRKVHLDAWSLV